MLHHLRVVGQHHILRFFVPCCARRAEEGSSRRGGQAAAAPPFADDASSGDEDKCVAAQRRSRFSRASLRRWSIIVVTLWHFFPHSHATEYAPPIIDSAPDDDD